MVVSLIQDDRGHSDRRDGRDSRDRGGDRRDHRDRDGRDSRDRSGDRREAGRDDRGSSKRGAGGLVRLTDYGQWKVHYVFEQKYM